MNDIIKDSIYTHYEPGIIPPHSIGQNTLWFIFDNNKLLVEYTNNKIQIVTSGDLEKWNLQADIKLYLGTMDGHPCFVGNLGPYGMLPDQLRFEDLRSLFGQLEEGIFLLAGRASQILNWHYLNRFCGRCGTPTEDKADERAKICPNCKNIMYPKLSPAIIVAIEKGDTILLAHATHFENNMYSVIAGFVEPGETLEDCVRREVKEEISIQVKNIKYFASQPWPYPNSLMIAFTAEYAGGTINVDHVEIDDAGWFNIHNLPRIPTPISISRSLIDQFINKNSMYTKA